MCVCVCVRVRVRVQFFSTLLYIIRIYFTMFLNILLMFCLFVCVFRPFNSEVI